MDSPVDSPEAGPGLSGFGLVFDLGPLGLAALVDTSRVARSSGLGNLGRTPKVPTHQLVGMRPPPPGGGNNQFEEMH